MPGCEPEPRPGITGASALRLVSGEEVEGTVTSVGKELVHVSRLSGKEFYDALISLDKITAIRMRMRER